MKVIMNENNIAIGVCLASSNDKNLKEVISNGKTSTINANANEGKGVQRQESEKRASVRELAQMIFEESKVGRL